MTSLRVQVSVQSMRLILRLIFVFALSGFAAPVVAGAPAATIEPGDGQRPSQVKPAGRVLAVLSSDSSIYEEGLAGIRSGTSVDLKIAYLNVLEAEESAARPFLERADAEGFALIVAVGAEAGQQVYRHVRRTPVLFSMLSVPRTLPPRTESLCGVSMRIPIDEYFRVLKEISPGARRVHSFYSTATGAYLTGEGEYTDLKHGIAYSRERIGDARRFGDRLTALRGTADAVYIAADPLYDKRRFEMLSDFARQNGIILFSGFRSLVFAGATFGIAPDYYRIGSLTGSMIERIVGGTSNCAREGIVLPDRSAYFFYLNAKFARESGIEVPAQIRERARNVRLLRAGIEFFNEGKLKSARAIFDHLLSRDPTNAAVSYYRARVVARLDGAAIAGLIARAVALARDGNWEGARVAYRKVLTIQGEHVGARRGLMDISRAQQEAGTAAYNAGRLFQALEFMEAALITWPENTEAAARLKAVRAREAARVPALVSAGRDMYTKRNYAGAIETFSNVLMLAPGERTAVEYLRLSQKKKAAMERLRQKIRDARRDGR